MILYDVFHTKVIRIFLELDPDKPGWVTLIRESKHPQGHWTSTAVRVPTEGLRGALSKVTIRHEVGA